MFEGVKQHNLPADADDHADEPIPNLPRVEPRAFRPRRARAAGRRPRGYRARARRLVSDALISHHGYTTNPQPDGEDSSDAPDHAAGDPTGNVPRALLGALAPRPLPAGLFGRPTRRPSDSCTSASSTCIRIAFRTPRATRSCRRPLGRTIRRRSRSWASASASRPERRSA